jgi:hypothetical protein
LFFCLEYMVAVTDAHYQGFWANMTKITAMFMISLVLLKQHGRWGPSDDTLNVSTPRILYVEFF